MSNFPSHWVTTKGTTVFEFVTSGSRGWAQHYASTGAKFIRIGNLDHGSITLDLRDIQHVNPPSGAEGERTRLRPNDVLISITAELGMVGVVPAGFGEAYINQHIALARPRPDIHSKFVAWYFASDADGKKALRDMGRGGTKVGLGLDDIRNADVPLAPLPEQQRIADKLDTVLARVDAVNDRLARVAPLLKRFRQSVLAAATSGRLTADWRGDAAPSWHTLSADEACAKVQSGGTPKAGFAEEGIPFLKVYNIVDQRLNFNYRPQFVSPEVHGSELRKSRVLPGDVLMNIVGPPLCKVAIVPSDHAEWNINQAITLFRPSEKVSSSWLYIVLCGGQQVRDVLTETKGSVGQVNISLSQCRAFRLPIPSAEEQAEIVRRVDILFAFADRLEARLQAAQTAASRLTPALLAKAFRGELVPQDPADEPAAELLRRMAAAKSVPVKKARAKRAS